MMNKRQYVIVTEDGDLLSLQQWCDQTNKTPQQHRTLLQRLNRHCTHMERIDKTLSRTRVVRISLDDTILLLDKWKEIAPEYSNKTLYSYYVLTTGEVVYGEHRVTPEDKILCKINTWTRCYMLPDGVERSCRGAKRYIKHKETIDDLTPREAHALKKLIAEEDILS